MRTETETMRQSALVGLVAAAIMVVVWALVVVEPTNEGGFGRVNRYRQDAEPFMAIAREAEPW